MSLQAYLDTIEDKTHPGIDSKYVESIGRRR